MHIFWTFLILAIVVGGWCIYTYNRLVSLRNEALGAFSGIEVQLKRRADLIPNLVEVVKGYAAHESGVFQAVTAARGQTMAASGVAEAAAADRQMTSATRQLFAVAEGYPDLKASTNFMALQDELATTEDKVAAARRYYNAVVRRLNTFIQAVPSNVIAGLTHITPHAFFNVEDDAERAPVATAF